MNRSVVKSLQVIGILVACLPASLLATFMLFPFWSWLEAVTGIEAMGHSGPAEWCYIAIYLLGAAIMLILFNHRIKAPRGTSHVP